MGGQSNNGNMNGGINSGFNSSSNVSNGNYSNGNYNGGALNYLCISQNATGCIDVQGNFWPFSPQGVQQECIGQPFHTSNMANGDLLLLATHVFASVNGI